MAGGRTASLLRIVAVALAVAVLFSTDAGMAMALTLTSSAFQPGGKIPSRFTCEGDDRSPPLAIEGVPAGTKSLALILDDPDAPDPKAPQRVWVHWVVYNLPPETKSLAENAGSQGLPQGAVTGHQRPQAERLSRPVPAHRPAPLFP